MPPLPQAALRELILADMPIEMAFATPSAVRCALLRLAFAVLERKIDRRDANCATAILSQAAAQNQAAHSQAARERELDLKAQEIATARELAERLSTFRAQPTALIQAVEASVHLDSGSHVLEHESETAGEEQP